MSEHPLPVSTWAGVNGRYVGVHRVGLQGQFELFIRSTCNRPLPGQLVYQVPFAAAALDVPSLDQLDNLLFPFVLAEVWNIILSYPLPARNHSSCPQL